MDPDEVIERACEDMDWDILCGMQIRILVGTFFPQLTQKEITKFVRSPSTMLAFEKTILEMEFDNDKLKEVVRFYYRVLDDMSGSRDLDPGEDN